MLSSNDKFLQCAAKSFPISLLMNLLFRRIGIEGHSLKESNRNSCNICHAYFTLREQLEDMEIKKIVYPHQREEKHNP